MPDTFGASAISIVLSKDEAIVRGIAVALPLQSKTRQGSRRNFSFGDAVAIVIVDDLCRAGLPKRAAFAICAELARHLVRVVAEEDTFRPWLIVRPDANASVGFAWTIEPDAETALDAVQAHPLSTVLNVAEAVRGAMARLLEAKRSISVEVADVAL